MWDNLAKRNCGTYIFSSVSEVDAKAGKVKKLQETKPEGKTEGAAMTVYIDAHFIRCLKRTPDERSQDVSAV